MQAHLDLGTAERYTDDVNSLLAKFGPDGMAAMYYVGPARLLLAAGDPGQARAVLQAFLTGTAESMPKDAEWLEAHWAMAEMAVRLDDQVSAAALLEVLRPYEQLWAVDGSVLRCWASSPNSWAGWLPTWTGRMIRPVI